MLMQAVVVEAPLAPQRAALGAPRLGAQRLQLVARKLREPRLAARRLGATAGCAEATGAKADCAKTAGASLAFGG